MRVLSSLKPSDALFFPTQGVIVVLHSEGKAWVADFPRVLGCPISVLADATIHRNSLGPAKAFEVTHWRPHSGILLVRVWF